MSRFFKIVPTKNFSIIRNEILELFPYDKINVSRFLYLENNVEKFLQRPNLCKLLEDFNLTNAVKKLGFCFNIMKPKFKLDVHIDSVSSFRYSLNIPLLNCEKSKFLFFQSHVPPTKILFDKYSYYKYYPNQYSLLEEHYIDLPYVLDTTVPHQVQNESDKSRVSLLIRLDPIFDEIVQTQFGFIDNSSYNGLNDIQ